VPALGKRVKEVEFADAQELIVLVLGKLVEEAQQVQDKDLEQEQELPMVEAPLLPDQARAQVLGQLQAKEAKQLDQDRELALVQEPLQDKGALPQALVLGKDQVLELQLGKEGKLQELDLDKDQEPVRQQVKEELQLVLGQEQDLEPELHKEEDHQQLALDLALELVLLLQVEVAKPILSNLSVLVAATLIITTGICIRIPKIAENLKTSYIFAHA
jgi:hypothetical protein